MLFGERELKTRCICIIKSDINDNSFGLYPDIKWFPKNYIDSNDFLK